MSLQDVKTLLGIENELQDDKINVIIKNTTSQLVSRLSGVSEVPEELGYIITEVSISRYNRVGNEGMKSFSQEGESMSYDANDFSAFEKVIDEWNDQAKGKPRRGRVMAF